MTRTSLTHRICALLIACWIPFCCCTLKAAVVMANGPTADGFQVISCCSGKVACPETSGEDGAPAEEEPCAGCCLKISPDAPSTPDFQIDEIGRERTSIDSIESPWLRHDEDRLACQLRIPPDPPPSDLVTLHCQLLV